MPKEKVVSAAGTSTWKLLLVAIAGGIVAVSLQPLILVAYAHFGVPTIPTFNRQTTTEATPEAVLTTTTTFMTTTAAPEVTVEYSTTTSLPPVRNDPTIDEEPILLKNESVTMTLPESTTVKSVPTEAPATKKVQAPEEPSRPARVKKATQPPELIDVTGRNTQIPDVVKNFQSTRISMPVGCFSQFVNERRSPPLVVLRCSFVRRDQDEKALDTDTEFERWPPPCATGCDSCRQRAS